MASTKKRVDGVEGVELGGSGTSVYHGVVSDVEYNPILSTEYGGPGLKIFERMRKSDPIVRASLNIIKLGIMQAEWAVEPAKDGSQEVADYVKEALFERMDRSWTETVRDMLTFLDFGFYVGEKVFKFEDSKVWLKKLAYRGQASISKFEMEDGKPGVMQVLSGTDVKNRTPSIPIEKIVILTNEKEGDNWRGVSVLRPAYKPWFFKEQFEKIDAISFEREHVGIPLFEMPTNPTPEDVTRAEELGKNVRANEKAHIILPYGWKFSIVTPQGGKQKDADDAICRFNRDILANVLAQFLDLGSGSTGSRALSEDQSDAFYKSLQSIGNYICSMVNSYVIPQLVDLNFSVQTYPKLTVVGIQKVMYDQFSSAVQRLILVGAIQPDDELEKHLRNLLHLPEKDMASYSKRVEEKQKMLQPIQSIASVGKDGKPIPPGDKGKDGNGDGKGKNGKKFAEDASQSEFWRPKTMAEERVNFRSIRRQMDVLEASVAEELPKLLMAEMQGLLTDARLALQTGDVKRIEDITVTYKEEVRTYVSAILQKSYEAGKLSASNELDIFAPRTPDDDAKYIATQANILADKMTTDLMNKAKLTVSEQISQSTPVVQAVQSLESLLIDEIVRTSKIASSGMVVGGMNLGRKAVFDQNYDQIYALQRSELLDSRVCNYCLSMDGRIVPESDPMANHGQFHYLCRGIWVAILNAEEDKPEITGIPEDLRDRVGTLSEFEQMASPRPLSGSLAAEFAKGKGK